MVKLDTRFLRARKDPWSCACCLLLRTKASTSGFWDKQARILRQICPPPRQRATKDSAFSKGLKAEVRACPEEAMVRAPKFKKDVQVLDPRSCMIVFHQMFPSDHPRTKEVSRGAK